MSQLIVRPLNRLLDEPDTDGELREAEYRRGAADIIGQLFLAVETLPQEISRSDLEDSLWRWWHEVLRWSRVPRSPSIEAPKIAWTKELTIAEHNNHGQVVRRMKANRLFPEDDPGFIYLVRASGSGFCKIGKTGDVTKRLKELESMNGNLLETITTAKVAACSKTEAVLHDNFAPKRKHGEWFNLDDNDISFIKIYLAGAGKETSTEDEETQPNPNS